MSGMPERQDVNNLIPMALSFGPAIFSAVFAFITKPTAEKTKTDALRKNLLETLRFKIAVEVAACLPVKKKKTPDDDYLEMCRSSLNNYFSANSPMIVDFLDSERAYRSYVRYFKVFKYAIVVIPIFTVLVGIISFLFCCDILSLKRVGVAICILIFFIVFFWCLKERHRDKYGDLCSKYEVVE